MQPGETLASASGKNVKNLLGRARKRQRTYSAAKEVHAPDSFSGPPNQSQHPSPNGDPCGAPAVRNREIVGYQSVSVAGDIGVVDWSAQSRPANEPSDAGLQFAGNSDWEDISEEDNDQLAANIRLKEGDLGVKSNGVKLELHFTAKEGNLDQKRPQGRRFTKEDRERARLIHRSHLLCLMGRGLLYDSAADDPLLQAAMLSLVPEEAARISKGLDGVGALVDWFHQKFKVRFECETVPKEGSGDEIAATMAAARGVAGVVESLQSAVNARSGTAENVCALFAATLRAMGYTVRTVRRLEPNSLKPAEALRQQAGLLHRNKAGGRRAMQTASVLPAMKLNAQTTNESNGTMTNLPVNESMHVELSGNSRKKQTGNRRQKLKDSSTDVEEYASAKNNAVDAHASAEDAETNNFRKCDEEFELEMALALAATDFEGRQNLITQKERIEADTSGNGEDSERLKKTGVSRATWRSRKGALAGSVLASDEGLLRVVGRYWVEVYCGGIDDGRWVHACPVLGWLDRPEDVESLAPRGSALAYVVAFAGDGAKDVTRRYASSFISSEKQREGEWWEETLRPLRSKEVAAMRRAGGDGTRSEPPAQPELATAREDRELNARAAIERQGLPTTIEGFRSHTTFVLARHIGKYQALRPGSKAMGMHRGEPYYLREDVCDVHTAERWRRLGREVVPEELYHPAKKIKKRGSNGGSVLGDTGKGFKNNKQSTSDLDDTTETERGVDHNVQAALEMSSFYGEWQTREYVPPEAVDGKVPKNERGNVEVPPFAAALPKGTVHIKLPNVNGVCRRLNIDFAPALVGFDIHGGKSVPVLEGVVVCSEHELLVRAAYEEDMKQRAERAHKKRMTEAEASWRALLRALLVRVRLKAAYGTNEGPTSAQAEGAAMLVHDAAAGLAQRYSRSAAEIGQIGNRAAPTAEEGDYPSGLAGIDVEEI